MSKPFRELKIGEKFTYQKRQYKKVSEEAAADAKYKDDSVVYPISPDTEINAGDSLPEDDTAEVVEDGYPSEASIKKMKKAEVAETAEAYGIDIEGFSLADSRQALIEAFYSEEEEDLEEEEDVEEDVEEVE